MATGVTGRIFQVVVVYVVKVLKYRVDLAVNHLDRVVESFAVVKAFSLYHVTYPGAVQVCYSYNACI